MASVFYGVAMTIMAVLISEIYFSRYVRMRDFFLLVAMAVFEGVGFRQLTSWWRIAGFWQYLRKQKSEWGAMPRTGFRADKSKP